MNIIREANKITYQLKGNELYIERVYPFGLWEISLKKGKFPTEGSYTDVDKARAIAEKYLEDATNG